MTGVPERTLRHFPEGVGELTDATVRGAITARLLEDGDREDLDWWVREAGAAWIVEWIAGHAARRLSRRSRAFWCRAAGIRSADGAAIAEALWPLA